MDTTVWVGASDRNDDFHESSRSIVEAIRLGRLLLAFTTDFVIDETVTILGKRRGFGAQSAGESILSSSRVFVVYMEESILRRALERYSEYLGELSLTDVVSLVIMEKYHIKEVFSHDTDFGKAKEVSRKESCPLTK